MYVKSCAYFGDIGVCMKECVYFDTIIVCVCEKYAHLDYISVCVYV